MKTQRTTETVERDLGKFFREKGRMPTYSEMMKLFGVRSKSAVHFWIRKLLDSGRLKKDDRGFLRPVNRSFFFPWSARCPRDFPPRRKRNFGTSFPSTSILSTARRPPLSFASGGIP